MVAYPDKKFIQEFAKRTLSNIRDTRHGRAIRARDTALISFLLAVFVLPHERGEDDDFMGGLLRDYPGELSKVVEVIRVRRRKDKTNEAAVPDSLEKLPSYLRHAVAHINVKPESSDGSELTHLLVWNRVPNKKNYGKDAGKIDFIARVHIKRLRTLAVYVLEQMSRGTIADRYEVIDPVGEFDQQDIDT